MLHERTAVGALERERLGERDLHAALGDEPLVNTVYAQVASEVTPEAIVDVAHRMGIESDLQPVCSITLGTSVNPLEMTTAYATLAARVASPPTPLERVETPDGETNLEINERGSRCSTRTTPTSSPTRSRP